MNSISSISLSGMAAAQTAMSASAANLANLSVDGSRRQQVTQRALAPAGVSASIGEAATAGHDMAADIVGLMQAKSSFLANLAVFKTSASMTGALLNALA